MGELNSWHVATRCTNLLGPMITFKREPKPLPFSCQQWRVFHVDFHLAVTPPSSSTCGSGVSLRGTQLLPDSGAGMVFTG